ncbi:MAG TPA: hypothetical protein VK906_02690 [Egicoccus sp.]|nr:hypothetical protein [Egicoccus sp.]HSK22051.1 hypothetical protein [Egicoccus sp.]
MELDRLQQQQQLLIRQRLRPMVNQYQVHTVSPDGSEGPLVAFAQQKRMAFKEQVTLYRDADKSSTLCGFKARSVMDLGATYDVTAADGRAIGLFRKDFRASLLRSSWVVEQPGLGTLTGQERSQGVAIARRFLESLSWLPYHFDFVLDGAPAFSVVKKWGVRDRYVVTIDEARLDRRLVIAMAVALDALQSR